MSDARAEPLRAFGRFRLDPFNERLWRGEEELSVRRKTFEVLRYLVDRPDQLVTKAALLDAVWGARVAVSDSMPALCVSELRKLLDDDARTPHFIETVHGRGYRFIAKVKNSSPKPPINATMPSAGPAPIVVGREEDIAVMRSWLAQGLSGQRRIVFIAGEPGIGKTTFVRAFLNSITGEHNVRVGLGQCVEQYGAGEPYMPVLEALTRLAQEAGGETLIEILGKCAPSWLVQMRALLTESERKRLQAKTQPITRHRMLSEIAEALEAFSAEAPLVLALEDLHWSDFSTLELISMIARRTEPARLLIVGTYRPVEILKGQHPLRAVKQELELHQQANELRLKLLNKQEVADYLTIRFADFKSMKSSVDIASAIHHRTEGNPLFMANVIDYLVETGSRLDASTVQAPRTIQEMIERNLDTLGMDEQRVLEAASVAGVEFSAALVAAALERPTSEIETFCTRLARYEQFVQVDGVSQWPDGTLASSFRFQHSLYCEVLYARVPIGYRVELHRRIAERQEDAYGKLATEIAAELAYHFRHANDKDNAIRHLQIAGERAVARRAYHEADRHYRDALALLQTLSDSSERDSRELTLEVALASLLQATRGYSSVEAEEAYGRARVLAERVGGAKSLEVLAGFCGAAHTRGEQRKAVVLADQVIQIAQGIGTSAALAFGYYLQALPQLRSGDLIGARRYFEQSLRHYRQADFLDSPLIIDPGVPSLFFLGETEWYRGYVDTAVCYLNDAISSARRLNNPAAITAALTFGAQIYVLRRDFDRTLEASYEAERLSSALGLPLWKAISKINGAWAQAQLGQADSAIKQIQDGIAELDEIKLYTCRAGWLIMLSETKALSGSIDDALVTLDQALQTNPEELLYRADALRLRGEFRLRGDSPRRARLELAERDFREAIEVARGIGTKSMELRATTSLARLLRAQARRGEARTALANVYAGFAEGFDTADLKAAKALLDS